MKKLIIILGMLAMTFPNFSFKTNECYSTIKSLVESDEQLKFKEITFAKFVFESGYFRSVKSVRYNNFTGMKFNSRKYCIGKTKDGYAIYKDAWSCLEDYKMWQLKHLKNVHSETQYLKYLEKVYCRKNPKYISNILKIKRKIFEKNK